MAENEDNDPLRAYAAKNAATAAVKPKSSAGPFIVSLVVTAVILAAAFYLWGR